MDELSAPFVDFLRFGRMCISIYCNLNKTMMETLKTDIVTQTVTPSTYSSLNRTNSS